MKKIGLLITFLFFFAGISTQVKATHAAGGEVIYEWVSGSTYRIIFKFYRDCAGISGGGGLYVCAYNPCTNQSILNTLGNNSAIAPTYYPGTNVLNGAPVSAGCAGYPTICNGGVLPGYEEWWYICEFNLPSQCNNWIFYAGVNNRNAQIDNLGPNPGGLILFTYATLNNVLAQGNNSPVFTVKPVPYTCVNMPFTYNNGAIDPDGDSLSFEFVNPSTGSTLCGSVPTITPVMFAPVAGVNSFNNINNPFATNNSFVFNTYTGEMGFIPAVQSEDVVAVKVHEYRNGVEIGTVMRDIQLNIRTCSIPAPDVLLDVNSIVGFYTNGQIEVCVNQPLHFCFDAMTDANRILVLNDNHGYISNNMSVNYIDQGTDTVTGCVDWIPVPADTGQHLFVVTVKDSTCDISGITVTNTLTIPLRVWPGIEVTLHGDSVVCPGGYTGLSAVGGASGYQWVALPGGSGNGSITCPTCDSTAVFPTVTTTYAVYSTSVFGCPDTSTMTVRVLPAPVASAPDTSVCIGMSVQLQGSGGVTYLWYPSIGLNSTSIPDPVFSGANTTTYNLVVTGNNTCTDTDQVTVTVRQPEAVVIPDSAVCPASTFTLYASGGIGYNWFPATNMTGGNTPTPTVTVNGSIIYYVVVTDILGCIDTAAISLSIVPPPLFAASPAQDICLSDSVLLYASGGSVYEWYPNSFISSATSDSVIVWPLENMLYYVAITEPVCSYRDTLPIQVNIHALPEVKVTRADTIGCGQQFGQLEATGAVYYRWLPGETLNNDSIANPLSHTDADTWYYVTGTDKYGCENGDSVRMRIIFDNLGGLFAPTVFSPNSDGKNDCYRVLQPVGITEFELHIYNRYGQNVYSADDAGDCWDGTFKGRLCDVGVYFYYYKFKSPTCGKTIEGKGDVTLVR